MSKLEVASKPTLTVVPKGAWLQTARFWHLVVALVGTVSFVVSTYTAMTKEGNGGALNGLIFSISYFTVLSNILVAVVNWMLFFKPDRDGKVFRWFWMTTLVMIVITGLVYDIVLAPTAHPTGTGVYTTIGYHYIVPWATLAGFLLFGPRPRFTLRHVFEMLIIPILWLAYTMVRGAFLTTPPASPPETVVGQPQHWYPYPFIDVNDPSALIPGLTAPGYGGVGINIVLILLLGIVFGFLFLGIDRWFSGGRKPTPLGSAGQEVTAVDPVAPSPAAAAVGADPVPVEQEVAAVGAVSVAETQSDPEPPKETSNRKAQPKEESKPKEEAKERTTKKSEHSTEQDSSPAGDSAGQEPTSQPPAAGRVEANSVVASGAVAAATPESELESESADAPAEGTDAGKGESSPKEESASRRSSASQEPSTAQAPTSVQSTETDEHVAATPVSNPDSPAGDESATSDSGQDSDIAESQPGSAATDPEPEARSGE